MIQCGSYTGDGGSSNSVNLGFEPQWIMIKASTDTSSTDRWVILDNIRGIVSNGDDEHLNPDYAGAALNAGGITLTPNGFYLESNNEYNKSGETNIYIAIRRGPMQTPTSRASIFEVDQRHSGTPNYTTTFPVDMAINPTTAGGNVRLTSRILGNNKLLVDNAGSLEGGDSGQDYAHNDGVNLVNSSTYYAFMWRRAPMFFDVVTYVGTGSAILFGMILHLHPLFLLLELMIV